MQELHSAKKAYADLKGRMAKHGRSPEQLSILPGVMPIIGTSEAEAKEKLDRLQANSIVDRVFPPSGRARGQQP